MQLMQTNPGPTQRPNPRTSASLSALGLLDLFVFFVLRLLPYLLPSSLSLDYPHDFLYFATFLVPCDKVIDYFCTTPILSIPTRGHPLPCYAAYSHFSLSVSFKSSQSLFSPHPTRQIKSSSRSSPPRYPRPSHRHQSPACSISATTTPKHYPTKMNSKLYPKRKNKRCAKQASLRHLNPRKRSLSRR